MNRLRLCFKLPEKTAYMRWRERNLTFKICKKKKELTEKYIIKMYLLNAFYYLISGNVQISCKTS